MAITAESVVVELEAKTGQFDATIRTAASGFNTSMSTVERSATQAERAVARSSSGIVASSGQVGQATRNLGFQISDVGAQLSGGSSPFVIFGQQAPQFVQAFEDIARAGATVGTVLRSVALPGIIAVISVLSTLIERQFVAADASNAHAKAADFLKEAVDRLAGASARSNHQTEIGINIDLRAAEAKRQNAIRTRQLIEAELSKQRGALSAAQATESAAPGALGIPGRGSGSRQANIDDVNRQLRENATAIQGYDRAIASGRAQLVLRGIAAQTDAATAATQRYDDRINLLQRRFERGQIDQGTFERLALATTRTRDAALDAAKGHDRASSASTGHAASLRVNTSAARDAAAAQRELEAALAGLVRKYDPVTAAAADYAAELKKIADLQKAGALTPEKADQYREGAGSTYRKARADAFSLDTVENFRPQAAADEKAEEDAAKAQKEAALDAERSAQQTREQNVRSLANLYEDLFTQGSGRAWENFQRDGLRAIAVVLAQATIKSFSSGGGGLGSLLGNITGAAKSLFSGTPKFAGGGSMLIGGNAGVDQNTLSLNGQPIAAVSRGESLNISPTSRAAQRPSGGTTIVSAPQFNLKGAILTRELYADMQRISAESAAQAGKTAYKQSLRDAPGALAQRQTLKGA